MNDIEDPFDVSMWKLIREMSWREFILLVYLSPLLLFLTVFAWLFERVMGDGE